MVATALVLAVLWAIGPPLVDSLEVRVQQLGLVDLGLVDLFFGVNFFFSVSTVWPLLPVSEAPNAVAVVARVALPSQNGDVEAVHDPDPAPDRVEYIDRFYSFDVFRFY